MLDPSHHLPQILAAFTEPTATAILLGAFGALTVLAVVLSRFADRMGVPVVLLFLILGMLGGSEGIGGIAFSPRFTFCSMASAPALMRSRHSLGSLAMGAPCHPPLWHTAQKSR